MTSYDDDEPVVPQGWSPFAVSLIATLVLLLGLGGAVFGIYAGSKTEGLSGPASTVPQRFPTVTGAATPPSMPTASSAPDGFALPNVVGLDFQEARRLLRDWKLGVNVVFQAADAGNTTVGETTPVTGTLVTRGTTVTVLVKGEAPAATVPGVEGLSCSQAVGILTDHGLFPDYETGRTGVVLQQSPRADEPSTLVWNDKVKIWCGTATASASPG